MRANERQLVKSLDANLTAATKTGDTLSAAMSDLADTSTSLMRVSEETGLVGKAGTAAEEAFAELGRECARISLDLNTMTNVAITARVALEASQADYHNLPPVELTSGQRSTVSSARASKTQVYVSGYGPVSPSAAESIWLEQARVRRENEAAAALAALNTKMADATQAARSSVNDGWDGNEQLLDDDPQTSSTGSSSTGTSSRTRSSSTTSTTTGGDSSSTTRTTDTSTVTKSTGSVIGGGTKVVIDNPNHDWSDTTADGTVTGSTGTGRTGGTGIGGSGGSGGGSWSGAGGSGGAGGAGGLLAGGTAVGGVAAGAIGLGRGGLGGIGGAFGGGFGGAGIGGAGAAGGPGSAAFGVSPVGGASGMGGVGGAGMGGAGIGASASARAAGAMGSTMLGGPAVNGQGGATGGQAGAQAGGRGMMGTPMGGGAGGGSSSKSRRHGAGYLAPDVDIEDEATPVALGPAARAGSRDQVPDETPELDTDDEW